MQRLGRSSQKTIVQPGGSPPVGCSVTQPRPALCSLMDCSTPGFPGLHCLPEFVVVQWLSHVRSFETPWTAARQASLSFTISQSLLKLLSLTWRCYRLLLAFNLSQHQSLSQRVGSSYEVVKVLEFKLHIDFPNNIQG